MISGAHDGDGLSEIFLNLDKQRAGEVAEVGRSPSCQPRCCQVVRGITRARWHASMAVRFR